MGNLRQSRFGEIRRIHRLEGFMEVICKNDRKACGEAAAADGLRLLREALAQKSEVNIILATGLSQFDLLAALRAAEDIDWQRINAFHLDEYVGLSIRHAASFRAVLWREFARKLPIPLKSFQWIDGESDPDAETRRLDEAITRMPIDVAFVGIGENGHLAFNDPPADFATEKPYLVVKLDQACRRQQMGEGWFPTIDDVPEAAISMSVRQIMKSRHIICTTPDGRKAEAVKNTLEQKVGNLYPASMLRCHSSVGLYLDADSASLVDWLKPGVEKSLPVEPMP